MTTYNWAGQIPYGDIWVTVGYSEQNGQIGATWLYMTRNMPNDFIQRRLDELRKKSRIMGLIQFHRDGTPAQIVPYRAADSAIQSDEGEQNAIRILERVKEAVVMDLIRILNTQSVDFSQGSGKTTVRFHV